MMYDSVKITGQCYMKELSDIKSSVNWVLLVSAFISAHPLYDSKNNEQARINLTWVQAESQRQI